MKRGLEGFQSDESFLEGLHHREVGRGMMVLDTYMNQIRKKRREARNRLKTCSNQQVEINAQIRQYNMCIEKSIEVLKQYFGRFYQLCD